MSVWVSTWPTWDISVNMANMGDKCQEMSWQVKKGEICFLKGEKKAQNPSASALRDMSWCQNGTSYRQHFLCEMLCHMLENATLQFQSLPVLRSTVSIKTSLECHPSKTRKRSRLGWCPHEETVVWDIYAGLLQLVSVRGSIKSCFLIPDPVSSPQQMSKHAFSSDLDLVFQGQSYFHVPSHSLVDILLLPQKSLDGLVEACNPGHPVPPQ